MVWPQQTVIPAGLPLVVFVAWHDTPRPQLYLFRLAIMTQWVDFTPCTQQYLTPQPSAVLAASASSVLALHTLMPDIASTGSGPSSPGEVDYEPPTNTGRLLMAQPPFTSPAPALRRQHQGSQQTSPGVAQQQQAFELTPPGAVEYSRTNQDARAQVVPVGLWDTVPPLYKEALSKGLDDTT